MQYNYHLLCVGGVRTFKIYSLSNFQVCNTLLLTITIMLCNRSPELTSGGWHLHVATTPQPLVTSTLLSVSVTSAVLEFTCIWYSSCSSISVLVGGTVIGLCLFPFLTIRTQRFLMEKEFPSVFSMCSGHCTTNQWMWCLGSWKDLGLMSASC